ncbi:hypothetical protein DICPUDRAFT_93134 [Dictyostelium purpureum]|uniref:Uncharacterized protein n=1 Tax=Dictyostelium purpureum TaxID=5786 RepID=F1A2R3_DICPU|nr:uncharacterized protein DICPUDRAFT_93134 [Dictyostelium purpureum]EGC29517.1 hypothetical protein DICPUDRAFT_93134 [Dictyostelium purpureum]|eukprot:XP_003293961.1 hypothetical protein DICPUDRAFT_93134 [Dictyostelium purpureum]
MSNPFDKNESTLTSTEVPKDQNGLTNSVLQSTLLKRVGGTPVEERLKKFPGEVDKISNESGSHCGASPFDLTKQDHSNIKSANNLQQLHNPSIGNTNGVNQSISLSSNQQRSISLEKIYNTNQNNQRHDDENFVSVPFSPPMQAFSLERTTSNSELPYMNPDGGIITNANTNRALGTSVGISNSTDPLLNPGIDRSYYNMNSRIGSNIPLDNANNDSDTRVTTAVRSSPQLENVEDEEDDGPMVNININPGPFAEPNGAEVPAVVRRRRNGDTIGITVMVAVILIIIGGCIAFLFI